MNHYLATYITSWIFLILVIAYYGVIYCCLTLSQNLVTKWQKCLPSHSFDGSGILKWLQVLSQGLLWNWSQGVSLISSKGLASRVASNTGGQSMLSVGKRPHFLPAWPFYRTAWMSSNLQLSYSRASGPGRSKREPARSFITKHCCCFCILLVMQIVTILNGWGLQKDHETRSRDYWGPSLKADNCIYCFALWLLYFYCLKYY